MVQVKIEWDGPYTPYQVLADSSMKERLDCPGVYLWILMIPNSSDTRIEYVGKSESSLWTRTFQHFITQIGVGYMVPEEFYSGEGSWAVTKDCNTAKKLFDKKFVHRLIDDEFSYINSMQLYFSRQESDIKSIESSLIYDLQPVTNSRGKAAKPNNYLDLRHDNIFWTVNNPNIKNLKVVT